MKTIEVIKESPPASWMRMIKQLQPVYNTYQK
jgi:hypothetical protein